MAEKTDKTVCSICLSDFSNPKLIDCHHSFCFRCLEGYVKKFTVNNHFPCPLCRRDIAVPAGGVKDFVANFYVENSSGKVHSDFCSNHRQQTADVYCKDCAVVVCSRCIVRNHNGHQLLDITDDETHQPFREELQTLRKKLRNQISKYKNFSHSLEVKVSEVSETADKICSQVDDQIQKIYDELKSLGEKTKIRVNNWRDEETNKLNAVNKEIQIECENAGEIVDNSDDVLENKSYVQLIEILPDIRKQQTKQRKRKLVIPFVKSVKFQEGKINSDILSQQVGILDKPSLKVGLLDRSSLEVGQIFCFTTKFNMSQVEIEDVTWKPADGDDVIPWTVGVSRFVGFTVCEGTEIDGLGVTVKLDTITDKTVQHVDYNYRHELINNTTDSQSVNCKDCDGKISPGCSSDDWPHLIVCKTLKHKKKGFLDSSNNFRIQTTITITGLSR